MSKRPSITFDETPTINAEIRKATRTGKVDPETKAALEMLSARVTTVKARQFRALAKLKGQTVQELLDAAIGEYLERHRI